MTKHEQIKADMIAAMKNRDKKRKDVLSFLVAQLNNAAIDKRSELTTDEVNVIINKQIKQTEDVLAVIPAERVDLIEENKFTIAVLKEYAPVMMTEEEIHTYVEAELLKLNNTGVDNPSKLKGMLMKTVMPVLKGKADGALINKVVSECCK